MPLKRKLKEMVLDADRAQLLAQIGWWQRDMNRLEDAKETLERSLALASHVRPANRAEYETTKQLLSVLLKLNDKNAALEVMGRLLRLDPHNPTVFNDCFEYARSSSIGWADLVALFEKLQTDYRDDQLVQANCDFCIGRGLMGVDPASAKKRIITAERSLQKILSRDHHVFTAISTALRALP
jgi:tetratricopeptide (TPR) repeat protein